jgi:hypothetical protein
VNRLFARAVDAPVLALLVLLAVAFMLAGVHTLVEAYREGRDAGETTASERQARELRQDAATPERRHRLQLLQGRRDERKAS